MRLALVIGLFAAASLVQADRLITIPTGRKLAYGTVRYEFRLDPSGSGNPESLLGIGIGTSFDMELRTEDQPGQRTTGTFDLAYNFLGAVPGLLPGLSLGVQDALDQTRDGRRFFAATTFREPFETLNGEFPADITLGMFIAKKSTPFVGVEVPFSKEFHLLAEHNGIRIAAGAEYRPIPLINLRAQVIGQRSFVSVQVFSKF